jgi:hypothetical protein
VNALYVAANFAVLLSTMAAAAHVMITNRWPWQRKPIPTTTNEPLHHCRTCRLEGRPIPAYTTWRDLLCHDLAEHQNR